MLLQTAILLILVLLTLAIILWELYLFKVGGATVVNTPRHAHKKIFELLEIDNNSVVYDLGCGNAQVLNSLYGMQPNATYIGIEGTRFGYMHSSLNLIRRKTWDRIRVIKGDFFKHDISDATHIFVWLSPEMMVKLQPYLETTLKPGTRLVSSGFPFKDKSPLKEVTLQNTRGPFGKRLYLYEF